MLRKSPKRWRKISFGFPPKVNKIRPQHRYLALKAKFSPLIWQKKFAPQPKSAGNAYGFLWRRRCGAHRMPACSVESNSMDLHPEDSYQTTEQAISIKIGGLIADDVRLLSYYTFGAASHWLACDHVQKTKEAEPPSVHKDHLFWLSFEYLVGI